MCFLFQGRYSAGWLECVMRFRSVWQDGMVVLAWFGVLVGDLVCHIYEQFSRVVIRSCRVLFMLHS